MCTKEFAAKEVTALAGVDRRASSLPPRFRGRETDRRVCPQEVEVAGSPTARRRRLARSSSRSCARRAASPARRWARRWTGAGPRSTAWRLARVESSRRTSMPCAVSTGPRTSCASSSRALAKESKTRGWWHAHGDAVPAWFSVYVGLEQAASSLRTTSASSCPGLLQTADYAPGVALGYVSADPDDVERHVAVRMERQALLTAEEPPDVWAIVHETVLRHVVGNHQGDARTVRTHAGNGEVEERDRPGAPLRRWKLSSDWGVHDPGVPGAGGP